MLKKLLGGLSVKDSEAKGGSGADQKANEPSFSKPSVGSAATGPSFTDDYAFPCLWDAEEEEADAEDLAEEDLDTFEFDTEAPAVSRRSSQLPARAVALDGTPLVDYELHFQHRKDGKEAMPEPGGEGHLTVGSLKSNFITQEVLDKLPQGLTPDQKATVASSLPMSPLLTNFKTQSAAAFTGRTNAAVRARRAAIKGAVVAFITAGYSGKRFVFEKAKELGVKCIILDGPDNWSQVLLQEGKAERFIPIDFSDTDTVFERCLEALKKVREDIGLDGVTTFNEFAVPIVARLAEQLGLAGNPPSACDLARDKRATRKVMEAQGLPSPLNAMIYTEADIDAAAKKVGFPAVIKPIAAAASMGVVRVDSLPELRKKVTEVWRKLELVTFDDQGILRQLEEGEEMSDALKPPKGYIKKDLMMEEYLDGAEVDCDLVLSEGSCTYGAVTDNWPTIEPYFNETGSNCPSVLSRKTQEELLDLAVKSSLALGFKLGVLHVELKATSRGPRLIEVNARMGGGGVRDINKMVWGVDLVEEHLLASCGLPAKPPIAKKPLMRVAEYSINAPATGIIQDTGFMSPWEGRSDVIHARPLVAPGEKVVCVKDGMPSWICEIMVTRPSLKEAIEYVKSVEQELKLDIAPLKVAVKA